MRWVIRFLIVIAIGMAALLGLKSWVQPVAIHHLSDPHFDYIGSFDEKQQRQLTRWLKVK